MCALCEYSFNIPTGWGFNEVQNYTDRAFPLLKIATPNFFDSLNYTGQEFWVLTFWATDDYLRFARNNESVNTISINGVTANEYKEHFIGSIRPSNNVYIFFRYGNHKYEIKAGYQD